MTDKTISIWDKVEKAIAESGLEDKLEYSAYSDDEDGAAVDNLDEIAAEGKVVFVAEADEFWGGSQSHDYRSQVLNNPTWLQVAVCANEMIHVTKDEHHAFLEGIRKCSKQPNAEVIEYEFLMGS